MRFYIWVFFIMKDYLLLKINSNQNEKRIIIKFNHQKSEENECLIHQYKLNIDLNEFHSKDEKYKKIQFNTDNNKITRYLLYPKRLDKLIFCHSSEIKSTIKSVVSKMNEILYTKPYYIFFGRIKSNEQSSVLNNINDSFYEGFDIDI